MPADALANFDIDNPDLAAAIADQALTSGDYPYDKRMKRKLYTKALYDLQVELVKVLSWLQDSGERLVMVFEARDAAGKGGTIKVVRQYLNPPYAGKDEAAIGEIDKTIIGQEPKFLKNGD